VDLRTILDQAREWLDDEVTPYLYDDTRLKRYANEAHEEACVRTRCLVESDRAAVCTITLVEGQGEYTLHPSIVLVRRAEYRPSLTGAARVPLRRTTSVQLDREDPSWTLRTGRPEAIVQDLQQRKLRLSHLPTADTLGTIQLTVWRRPLDAEQLTHERQSPLVDPIFHLKLAHWICYRALLTKDGEGNDSSRAGDHLSQFEAAFGPPITAARLRQLATDDAGETVGYFF
jgi:hypothetical protein